MATFAKPENALKRAEGMSCSSHQSLPRGLVCVVAAGSGCVQFGVVDWLVAFSGGVRDGFTLPTSPGWGNFRCRNRFSFLELGFALGVWCVGLLLLLAMGNCYWWLVLVSGCGRDGSGQLASLLWQVVLLWWRCWFQHGREGFRLAFGFFDLGSS